MRRDNASFVEQVERCGLEIFKHYPFQHRIEHTLSCARMQDSFFAPARKRKRTANSNKLKTTDKPTTKRKTDEEIESAEEEEDDNENLDGVTSDEESSEDEDVQETAAEKRVRLAKAYLEKVQKGIEGTTAVKLEKKGDELFLLG